MSSENKLDQILEQLTDIKVVQATHTVLHTKNSEDLEEHIRRTEAAEARIEKLEEKSIEFEKQKIAKDSFVNGALKTLGLVGGALVMLATCIAGIIEILYKLNLL